MKLIKRITINIYETGESTIDEETFENTNEYNAKYKEEEDNIREFCTITRSWDNYNLIIYSKKSKIYSSLKEVENQKLKIKFDGKYFYGKIDSKNARIYSLKELMKYARNNNLKFDEGNNIVLLYSKPEQVLSIELVNKGVK